MDFASALEGARRDLSGLPQEDHHSDRVAQPPHHVANPRGQRHDREPRARASELPPADPQPRFRCWETASREGRLKGLSYMRCWETASREGRLKGLSYMRCWETASREGRLKGLSYMNGNI